MDASDAESRYRRAQAHAVLRGVVHDLNNPLATAAMAAAALRSVDDGPQRADLIDIIEREVLRAGSLATDAADHFGGPWQRPRPVALQAMAASIREQCDRDALDVDLHLGADPDRTVLVDPDLLPRALTALIADAHRAPGRRLPVQVQLRLPGTALVVTIADDGAPVSGAVATRPFQPVLAGATDDVRGVGTDDVRGVGIDVATARAYVLGAAGALTLVPGATSGNLVEVRLPDRTGGEAPRPDRADVADAPSRHALVVDDDEATRTLLAIVLRRAGWQVATASDGATAERAAADGPHGLVLLDLHLRAELGSEVASRLERVQPGVGARLVFVTGDPAGARAAHGRPVLAKPFTLDELYAVVEQVTTGV